MAQNDVLKMLLSNEERLKQTETRETPGNIPGFTSFYATGSYVPTYLGNTTAGVTTYTAQAGQYVRIGRVVIATGTITWTAATGTGNANISLPITAVATANLNITGSVATSGVTFANNAPQIFSVPGVAFFNLISPLTNAASPVVQIEAAGTIVFTVTYFVA